MPAIFLPGFPTVVILNPLGERVQTLLDGRTTYAAGTYHVEFDASRLAAGTYHLLFRAGAFHGEGMFEQAGDQPIHQPGKFAGGDQARDVFVFKRLAHLRLDAGEMAPVDRKSTRLNSSHT